MDWRNGKPNATGSAFRGISTRGRGRGRGRGAPPSGRGGHPAEPATPIPAPPTPAAPPQEPTTSTSNLPSRPKPSSRRGSHQHARRAPSLSHLDLPKASTTPSEQQTTPGTLTQVARRASHNPLGSKNEPTASQSQIPSVKLDPLTPTTPGSQRPKPSRKRSQNRTRSSSKASTQDRLSATPSIASLKEKEKDIPPHLPPTSAPPGVQSFDLRTNIDTLVERVRAMAMAGSAADRDKDKEGLYVPHEGHIDWAGDDDDTLPDLDDWVRPKSAEPREVEKAEDEKTSDKPVLSPVEEISPGLPTQDNGKEKKGKAVGLDSVKGDDKNHRTEGAKEVKELKATNEVNSGREKESSSGRTKTRGKHSRKKGSASDPLSAEIINYAPSPVTKSFAPEPHIVKDSSALSAPKIRPPLVHPLPPKPQLTSPPARGPRARGPQQAVTPVTQQATRIQEGTLEVPSPSAVPSPEEKPVLSPPIELLESSTNTENNGTSGRPPKATASNPNVDWAKTSRQSDTPSNEAASDVKDDVDSSTAPTEPQSTKHTFDTSVDWVKASRSTPGSSPSRRSPNRDTRSSKRTRPFSPLPHPQTAPPHGRPRGLFPPSQNGSPPVFPDLENDAPPPQTRSQLNSPEPNPRRWLNREGANHIRSHSSPQTGPGTRTHASRPVITVDAISRLSRTLGVSGATTPPRGQVVGVSANE